MNSQSILVIEDEKDISDLIRYNLEQAGYNTMCAYTGEDGLAMASSKLPDLILLDLMLPGLDGLEVCRALKADPRTRSVPVVMLTARGEEVDIVTGLEMGAEDYIVKPFSPRVLVARLRAVLRRKRTAVESEDAPVKIGEMIVDPGRHEVVIDGKPLTVTTTEFRLLHFLARRPGWVFTRDQIVDSTHSEDAIVTDRSVDVHIASLRKKLGEYGQYIETVRGVGYRFREHE